MALTFSLELLLLGNLTGSAYASTTFPEVCDLFAKAFRALRLAQMNLAKLVSRESYVAYLARKELAYTAGDHQKMRMRDARMLTYAC